MDPVSDAQSFTAEVPETKKFLEDLLVEAGFEKANEPIKEMMLSDLSIRLHKFLFMAIAETLSEQELETFFAMAEVDQVQALAYLRDIKPESPQIMLKAFAEFREIFLQEEKAKK